MFGWKFILGKLLLLLLFLFNMYSNWHSLVATWFTLARSLLNSSLTLWMCPKSQKDGQNYTNTGVRRAILPKCPSTRANPSLDGRLWNTADCCETHFLIDNLTNAPNYTVQTYRVKHFWNGASLQDFKFCFTKSAFRCPCGNISWLFWKSSLIVRFSVFCLRLV